ncbi:hypothetical protein D3C76_498560 [compost metagenome]
MSGVHQRLQVLQPISLIIRGSRAGILATQVGEREVREFRRLTIPQVYPNDPAAFAYREPLPLHLLAEALIFLGRHAGAVAVRVETPAMEDAGQAIVLVSTKREGHATVRASFIEKAHFPIVPTKGDVLFAQQLYALRIASRSQRFAAQCWNPVAFPIPI